MTHPTLLIAPRQAPSPSLQAGGVFARSTPRLTLADAITLFVKRCRARSLSPKTIAFYGYRLDAFSRFLAAHGIEAAPNAITAAPIRDFLAEQRERVSAITASHSHVTLRTFFRFLVREELLDTDPMSRIEPVRRPRKVVQTFTPTQIEALLAACGRGFVGARMKAIIVTLLDCGLRVSELCALAVEDVCFETQTMRVQGKGSRERVVPFGEATRQALLDYLARRGELAGQRALFVNCYADALNRHGVHRLLRECGEKAGIRGARCSPHTFRHTCAVMYLRNGGDAFSLQKLLGHADLTMTRRYCELGQADVAEKHRLASPGDRFLTAVKPTSGRKRLR